MVLYRFALQNSLNVTGIDVAAPIWHESMLQAEKNLPINNFANLGSAALKTVYYLEKINTTDWY
jgi:hypothetical protein